MSDARTVELLNQLLAIQYRSLPAYLADAAPEIQASDARAFDTLQQIISDQRAMIPRIVRAIEERGGTIHLGGFPMDFTDTHMLGLDYLVRELLRWQRFDVSRIERLISQFQFDRAAKELAQEVLGAERAHLEALQELAAQPAT